MLIWSLVFLWSQLKTSPTPTPYRRFWKVCFSSFETNELHFSYTWIVTEHYIIPMKRLWHKTYESFFNISSKAFDKCSVWISFLDDMPMPIRCFSTFIILSWKWPNGITTMGTPWYALSTMLLKSVSVMKALVLGCAAELSMD